MQWLSVKIYRRHGGGGCRGQEEGEQQLWGLPGMLACLIARGAQFAIGVYLPLILYPCEQGGRESYSLFITEQAHVRPLRAEAPGAAGGEEGRAGCLGKARPPLPAKLCVIMGRSWIERLWQCQGGGRALSSRPLPQCPPPPRKPLNPARVQLALPPPPPSPVAWH